MKCPKCGNEASPYNFVQQSDVFKCIKCDTVFVSWQQSEISRLKAENERRKHGMEWQTGKPPREAYYWIKRGENIILTLWDGECNKFVENPSSWFGYYPSLEWSGPIPLPGTSTSDNLKARLEEAERVIDDVIRRIKLFKAPDAAACSFAFECESYRLKYPEGK